MSESHSQVLEHLAEVRATWDELLESITSGESIGSVLDSCGQKAHVGECKLLNCLDAIAGARKVDNRRFFRANGLDDRIVLSALTAEQRKLVVGAYDVQ